MPNAKEATGGSRLNSVDSLFTANEWKVENSFNSMLEQECINFLHLVLLAVRLLQRNEMRKCLDLPAFSIEIAGIEPSCVCRV